MTDHTQAREALERAYIRAEGMLTFDTRLVIALIASLDAEIAALKAEREWRSMDSAPRETPILIAGYGWVHLASLNSRSEYTPSLGPFGFKGPLKWQPLPKPPENGT